MELENKEWKEFFIEDIFKIKSGKRLTKADMKDGNMPFIGATDSNNGITEFISNKNSSLDKNVLGVNYNGSVVHNFYHPYQALFSDDVKRLTFKHTNGNKYLFLFMKTVILQQKSKYEYGYKFNGTRMKRQKILLPINENGNPDYAFMENYMREKESKLLTKYQSYISSKIKRLGKQIEKELEWKEFSLTEIFPKIQRGKRLKKADHIEGKTPYASSTALNNGIDGFIGNTKGVRVFQDCLTIANSGSVGSTFYQPFKVIASDHVTRLENKEFNKYTYLFLATIVSRLHEKYSFNREVNDFRIRKEKILLPINEKGNPDFEYMENYIKRIEQEKLLKHINHKQLNIS